MQDLLSVVTLGSIYLLFALGMSLTWGTIDILNFSHGSIFMFSVFTGYLILDLTTLPFLPVLLIGVAVGALMSLLVQVLAFEQILKRATNKKTAEMQILIGGIGVAIIPLAIAQHHTKSNPFGLRESSFELHTWVVGDLRITNIAAITVVTAAILWVAMALWLRRSRQGLALRAIGVDTEVASLMGVHRRRLALATMAVSGALAGLAGMLFTFSLGAITPESGDTLLVKAFACIILGGIGSMRGVLFGSYFLAACEVWVLTQTSGSWVEAVSFGLIFLVLLIRPTGVFGRKEVRRT
ncbi:branched-chain amino acid ABC transporter permease [Nocardioides sp. TF02-7]|uniref:branched-chain amino acid ABC transporter permease n=1 Tax=Nocardioides sp. TF02-7 TaxID=2917724 RepID=UPI001F055EF9|nr:branched-chain amino acid ABC transporter permease [Nocardioides sp. TF02-7]UMG91210.1 branched-chain amino acid ABC transporter permease [Nocardioides sp. TF02-7]